jgi:thiosulfate/3-mercaptopyruvate sulfurtransferase
VNPLVTTEWLAGRLGAPDLRVVDVRWYMDPARRGRDAYTSGHIPGAVFLDMDADLSAPGGGRGRPAGRHPWPGAEQVGRVMSAAGIGPGTEVVAYDDQAGAIAARLWYLLRAYGHDGVAVLDGGLAKWTAEGRPLETAAATPAPALFVPRPREGWVLDKAAMVREGPRSLVLDARAGPRFRGESDPVDPRAGHIPGARNAPYAENLTGGPVPVLRPPAELRARFEALGAHRDPPIVYCGSGVTACHDLLALELSGLPGGRLYAGSWSEWSADVDLPLATGEDQA